MQRAGFIILIAVLTIATILRLFSDIGRPATRWDEQTNIRVVTESTASKSFPVLYVNGGPFYEKPPLWYFLNIALGAVFGTSPAVMRLLSVLSGLLTIGVAVALVGKLSGWTSGIVTWAILLLSNQLFVKDVAGYFASHTLSSADPDALQIVFMLLAVVVLLTRRGARAPVLTGLLTGLAVLSKGPLGFVPLLVATCMYRKFPEFSFLRAWTISLLVLAPWYLFMYMRFGIGFLETHIGYHLVTRASLPLEGHRGPVWFYLTLLTNAAVYPVFPFVAAALFLWVRRYRELPAYALYIGVVTILLIGIPTVTGTKLAWYVLPAYPFMAMLTGLMAGIPEKSIRLKRQ